LDEQPNLKYYNVDLQDTIIVLFVTSILLSMQIGNFLLFLIKDWSVFV